MTVVDFPKRERMIWLCRCGCSTFYLYDDSTTECAACNLAGDGAEWVKSLADAPRNPDRDDFNSVSIKAIGSVDFAKHSVLKRISNEKDDVRMVAAWFDDGSMTSWCGAETQEQQDWAVEKANDYARNLAVRKMPDASS
jgi:hypothetical protein